MPVTAAVQAEVWFVRIDVGEQETVTDVIVAGGVVMPPPPPPLQPATRVAQRKATRRAVLRRVFF